MQYKETQDILQTDVYIFMTIGHGAQWAPRIGNRLLYVHLEPIGFVPAANTYLNTDSVLWLFPAQVVKERLICHAIIGKQSGKERIMKVDVTCEFIAPILHLSSREITFRVEKVNH